MGILKKLEEINRIDNIENEPEVQNIRETAETTCLTDSLGVPDPTENTDMTEINWLVPGIPDNEFIRDKVPMTKEEVREVSLCKLRLHKDSVLFDIGAGTGSVSVEAARLSPEISVYAVEVEPAGIELIKRNAVKFGVTNVSVVQALAPEGLDELPAPTHAFIGGTKGHLGEILGFLYKKNPALRVVMNAVSLESVSEMQEMLRDFPVTDVSVVQLSVSRAEKVGGYTMMKANNPVFVFAFSFSGDIGEQFTDDADRTV